MARSKKTIEELFNEQPEDVKKMIELIAGKAYARGFRDATRHEPRANDILQDIRI